MTPTPSKNPRRSGKIVLYRQQIETILVHIMGWEREDAIRFWQFAAQETGNPGCLDQMLRRETAKLLQSIEAEGRS